MNWRSIPRRAVRRAVQRAGYDLVPTAPAIAPAATPLAIYADGYDRVADLGQTYRETLGDGLATFEHRVFSQNGEDGVIAEILRRIGVKERWFVEFGAGTGGEGCCIALADIFSWSGLFIEADQHMFETLSAKYRANDRVRTRCNAVTTENIESLFDEAGVPAEPDVVSIDIDGNDYWVWRAVTRFRPRLVVIEYNSNLPPGSRKVRALDESSGWDSTGWFSASLTALEALAAAKGYRLAHTDLSGVNAFFVRDDLYPALGISEPERRSANYGLSGGRFTIPEDHPWVDAPD